MDVKTDDTLIQKEWFVLAGIFCRDKVTRKQIVDQTMAAIHDDGKLSVVEAAPLRRFILNRTGPLMRADAPETQEQSRTVLIDILK
ncbi:hypothetical protein AZH90_004368 [Salmonella enterica subsp. enterica serovar Legon]|nr:hypothetical protein [Salmonella enterica subsp. enterica serovar Weybridge]EDS6807096.1 hypothetical protein [Salmonella enterica subsp. enterica serovar Legon]EDW9825512.1 hypothetical protein [Salmonella enterica]EHL5833771.1 hypothetical protein [Salmonella enterica]